MEPEPSGGVVDSLTLRFVGQEKDGTELHELRASHVAEVLQGLVGLSSDFTKAGVFGEDGQATSEVLVRPPQEGSFLIEVVRFVQENQEVIAASATATGVPTLSQVIWWATQSARADVADFNYLDNGKVKITWQDKTVDEVPVPAWNELQKRDKRRKKHLRQIMAPLGDPRVAEVEVQSPPPDEVEAGEVVETFTLTKPDYDVVQPSEEVEETQNIFETEAQMAAIDFDNPSKWRVKTPTESRAATVEDKDFLARVTNGLAIRKTDIFRLTVRDDTVTKDGRKRRTWTVLKVESFRRAAHDDDT